jgi:hypothetical protein
MPVSGRRRSIRTAHLCRGYERAPEAASISYAAMRIFGSNGSPFGPMEIGRWLTFRQVTKNTGI